MAETSPFEPRRANDPHLSQWIVAEFSAWEHQRLEPPWWWLLAAMRRAIARELWRINRGRWLWFHVRDAWWHVWNARATLLALVLAGGLLLLAWLLDWFGLTGSDLTALKATAVSVTALIERSPRSYGAGYEGRACSSHSLRGGRGEVHASLARPTWGLSAALQLALWERPAARLL